MDCLSFHSPINHLAPELQPATAPPNLEIIIAPDTHIDGLMHRLSYELIIRSIQSISAELRSGQKVLEAHK
jgi:hypothetical protein